MIYRNYLTSLSVISRKIIDSKHYTATWITDDDLGLGLLVRLLQKEFQEKIRILEISCPDNSIEIGFSALKELIDVYDRTPNAAVLESRFQSFLATYLRSESAGKLIVFRNLQNLSEREIDRVIHFMKVAVRNEINAVFSIRNRKGSSVSASYFTEHARAENCEIVHHPKVDLDQFELIMKKLDFFLPSSFHADLFRLANGSYDLLSYSLSYFRAKKIINEKNEVEEKIYRYFTIPPSIEGHYKSEISNSGPDIRRLAYLISYTGQITADDASLILGVETGNLQEQLHQLSEKGVVLQDNGILKFPVVQIGNEVKEMLKPGEKQELMASLCSSSYFRSLPYSFQISTLAQAGRIEDAIPLVRENFLRVIDEHDTLEGLRLFISILRRKSVDDYFDSLLDIMECEGMYRFGESEEALDCYLSYSYNEMPLPSLRSRQFTIYRELGRYDESIKAVDSIISGLNSDDSSLAALYIENGNNLLASGRASDSFGLISRNLAKITGSGDSALISDAYYTLSYACIQLKKFDIASEYLENARSVLAGVENTTLSFKLSVLEAIILAQKGKYWEAIEKFQSVVDWSYLAGSLDERAKNYFNILEALEITGNKEGFHRIRSVAETAIKKMSSLPMEYEFFRLLTFHHINETDYASASVDAEKALSIALDMNYEQWVQMSTGLLDVVRAFVDGIPRVENSYFLTREFENREDIMPFYLVTSSVYFMILKEYEKYGEAKRALRSYNEKSKEFFGLAVQRIADISDILITGDVDLFRKRVEELGDEFDSVALYRTMKEVFKLIVSVNVHDPADLDRCYHRIVDEFKDAYPRTIFVSALSFLNFLELRVNGKSDMLSERLSNLEEFSPLVSRSLREEMQNAR